MAKKRVFYGSERQLEGLMLVAKSLDFGVSLTLASVYNEMLNAHLALRATPKYKHQLKKAIRHAESVAEQQRLTIIANMKKRDFYDAYSDAVIDCAKTDIALLRISMKQTLDDAKVEYSDALAWIEITHTLCSIAKIHYEGIVHEATKKYGHNYHDEFSEFDPTNLLVAWTRVSRLASADIKENIDLNTERNTALVKKLSSKFIDGEYVKYCLDEAKKTDEHFTNKIEVVYDT